MKRLMTSGVIATSMIFSPALRCEEVPEGTPVGQASEEATKSVKSKKWQNIALAVGAVAVAVTALVLVATNDGHK